MNLVIDIGNNYFKLAVFSDEILLFNESGKTTALEKSIFELIKDFPMVNFALISNVSNISDSRIIK